jgi:monovalent cation:H+ antiporter-2, CPA2 family
VAIVIFGKFLIVTPIVRLFGYPLKTALLAGLGLAQIGEFSFVLASKGQLVGLLSRQVYLLVLATTAVTLIATPFLLRALPILFVWADRIPWLQRFLSSSPSEPRVSEEPVPQKNHLVVCGYGQTGRSIVQLLGSNNYSVVVIEQSESVIQQLRDEKIPYVYGDAASLQVLEKAQIAQARAMAITLPDAMSTRLCLKRALEFSPELDVVVESEQVNDLEMLYQLGAKEVVQPKFEASLEVSAHLFNCLGLSTITIQEQLQTIRQGHYAALKPAERSAFGLQRDVRLAALPLNHKWYALLEGSPLVGMGIGDTDCRRLTGVTILALRRLTGEEVDYPDVATILKGGDRLLLVGQDSEITAFRDLAEGEVAAPLIDASCQWVNVPEDCIEKALTLHSLYTSTQYRVQIQALRRRGEFIRFPKGDTQLKAGDRVLLCGSATDIPKVTTLIESLGNATVIT